MNDPQFSLQLSMIAALAFVPPQDVVSSFDEHRVVIKNQYDGDADELLDILTILTMIVFVGIPLFPIELWNMFNRTA